MNAKIKEMLTGCYFIDAILLLEEYHRDRKKKKVKPKTINPFKTR